MSIAPVPRMKSLPKNAPERVKTLMKRERLSKVWEVKRTPSRKDDKAFKMLVEKPDGSYKLLRFGSIASEKNRFDSAKRRDRFRSRHSCDKTPFPKLGTAKWASCQITWHQNDSPKTVRNCPSCKKSTSSKKKK